MNRCDWSHLDERTVRSWNWLVFDIDGVLIEVSESYDVAVQQTVEHFLGQQGLVVELPVEAIRDLRLKGKFGDDYKVSEAFIAGLKRETPDEFVTKLPDRSGIDWVKDKYGQHVAPTELKNYFDKIYQGPNTEQSSSSGLWRNEERIAYLDLLDRLAGYYKLAAVTGRSRQEYSLARRIIDYSFEQVVTREVAKKPDPEALRAAVGTDRGLYIGDTENDRLLVENYRKQINQFQYCMVDQQDRSVNELMQLLVELLQD